MTETIKSYSYEKSGFVMSEDEMMSIAEKIGGGLCFVTIERMIKTKDTKSDENYFSVMITAPNNSYTDNGVKIIDSNGNNISEVNHCSDVVTFLDKYVNDRYDTDEIHKLLSSFREELERMIMLGDKKSINDIQATYVLTTLMGNDTRRSSEIIKSKITKGFVEIVFILNTLHNSQSTCPLLSCDFIDFDLTTVPEFKCLVQKYNQQKIKSDDFNYIDAYAQEISASIINKSIDLGEFIIDCANGVGFCSINKIFKMYVRNSKTEPLIINDKVYDYHKLCNNCGSDYVMNNHKQIHNDLIKNLYEDEYEGIASEDYIEADGKKSDVGFNFFCPDTLYASFNGNAEKIIFYYYNCYRFNVLSGDHISYLILNYLVNLANASDESSSLRVTSFTAIKISVIHTNKSDNNFVKAVDKIIKTNERCKNILIDRVLFENIEKLESDNIVTKSKKYIQSGTYDVSISYSVDGFGTMIVSDELLKSGIPSRIKSELVTLMSLFNQYTSDAIMTLIGFAYIMNKRNITCDQLSLFL